MAAKTKHIATLDTSAVKPYSVSHSKMATFRRCRQQFKWKYIDKYFPPSSMGQQRGTSGHAALARWHVDYDRTKAMDAAWENWSNAGFSDNEDWQQLQQALLRYFDWSADNDKFTLLVAEQKFEIDYEVGEEKVQFIGYIDGIVEENKQTWILENKFLKRMDNTENTMDQQVSLYMLAAHLMNYEAQGVIYNKVRMGSTKVAITEPVVRTRMHRNPQGISKIQDEMLIQIQDMINFEQKGGGVYRNPTKDCSWDCPFHAACLSMADDGQEPAEILQQISQIRSTDDNG